LVTIPPLDSGRASIARRPISVSDFLSRECCIHSVDDHPGTQPHIGGSDDDHCRLFEHVEVRKILSARGR